MGRVKGVLLAEGALEIGSPRKRVSKELINALLVISRVRLDVVLNWHGEFRLPE